MFEGGFFRRHPRDWEDLVRFRYNAMARLDQQVIRNGDEIIQIIEVEGVGPSHQSNEKVSPNSPTVERVHDTKAEV